MQTWDAFGKTLNNSVFFVIDKIIDLQEFFIGEAKTIGRVVLLIAILSAALNYALTGTGLKENIIKILKAALFFLIITAVYPSIIGWITFYTFSLAEKSVGNSVKNYFGEVTKEIQFTMNIPVFTAKKDGGMIERYTPGERSAADQSQNWSSFTNTFITKLTRDNSGLLNSMTENREHYNSQDKVDMKYTVIAPAAVLKILFFVAGECFDFAEEKPGIIPKIPRIIKGLFCGFFVIFTGAFALLEYVVCFLEFMLVASVGIILFPLSIWDASKFMAEKFIGAIIGFFMKLLLCNIAIFLLLYGFISMFYILSHNQDVLEEGSVVLAPQGFTGELDQILFVIFTCLLFFFICKAAPGVAQSLLSGSPSLNAAGAIGAVAGAVGAAAATAGFIKNKGNNIQNAAGNVIGGLAKARNTFAEAKAASNAAEDAGGSRANRAAAFMTSLGSSASKGLARSLYGNQSGGLSMGGIMDAAKQAGASHGIQRMDKIRKNPGTAFGKELSATKTIARGKA